MPRKPRPCAFSISSMCFTVTTSPGFIGCPLPTAVFASSSTALVMSGGTFSTPSRMSEESAVGFTSCCVKPP